MDKILVVEDNRLNLELVTDVLESAGFVVLQAVNASEGIALARAHLPALILMDLSLPGMNGLEAAKQLGTDALTRHIPVVAVSASAMADDRTRAFADGCVGFITKPLDVRSLAETAAAFIEQAKSAPVKQGVDR